MVTQPAALIRCLRVIRNLAGRVRRRSKPQGSAGVCSGRVGSGGFRLQWNAASVFVGLRNFTCVLVAKFNKYVPWTYTSGAVRSRTGRVDSGQEVFEMSRVMSESDPTQPTSFDPTRGYHRQKRTRLVICVAGVPCPAQTCTFQYNARETVRGWIGNQSEHILWFI